MMVRRVKVYLKALLALLLAGAVALPPGSLDVLAASEFSDAPTLSLDFADLNLEPAAEPWAKGFVGVAQFLDTEEGQDMAMKVDPDLMRLRGMDFRRKPISMAIAANFIVKQVSSEKLDSTQEAALIDQWMRIAQMPESGQRDIIRQIAQARKAAAPQAAAWLSNLQAQIEAGRMEARYLKSALYVAQGLSVLGEQAQQQLQAVNQAAGSRGIALPPLKEVEDFKAQSPAQREAAGDASVDARIKNIKNLTRVNILKLNPALSELLRQGRVADPLEMGQFKPLEWNDRAKIQKEYALALRANPLADEQFGKTAKPDLVGTIGHFGFRLAKHREYAANGNPEAQKAWALALDANAGVEDSHDKREKSLEWYRRAALRGDAWAQRKMADISERGTWAAKDYAKAYTWYARAAVFGDQKARAGMARLLPYLSPAQIEKAESHVAKAAYYLIGEVASRLPQIAPAVGLGIPKRSLQRAWAHRFLNFFGGDPFPLHVPLAESDHRILLGLSILAGVMALATLGLVAINKEVVNAMLAGNSLAAVAVLMVIVGAVGAAIFSFYHASQHLAEVRDARQVVRAAQRVAGKSGAPIFDAKLFEVIKKFEKETGWAVDLREISEPRLLVEPQPRLKRVILSIGFVSADSQFLRDRRLAYLTANLRGIRNAIVANK